MLKILGNIIFYLVILIAVLSMLQMYIVNKDLVEENNQLQEENTELLLDKINLEIDLENITDAYWQLNNQLERKQGAD